MTSKPALFLAAICALLVVAAPASAAPIIDFDASATTPDGKIVVLGTEGYFVDGTTRLCDPSSYGPGCTDSHPVVARFRADGSVDSTFALGSGYLVLGGADTGYFNPGFTRTGDVAVAPDGGIVVFTLTPGGSGTLVRVTPDGAIDGSFGDAGVVAVPGPLFATGADPLAVDSAGRVLLVGADPATGRGAVLRLTRSGEPDPSFGSGGLVTTPMPGAEALALRPGDRPLVVGGSEAVQLDSSGAVDTSYGDSGVAEIPVLDQGPAPFASFSYSARAITLDSGGEATILFDRDPDARDLHFRCGDGTVVRLTADGRLDPDFGDGGYAPPIDWACSRDLELLSSGGLFAISTREDYSPPYFLLETAFDDRGQLDPTFDPPARLLEILGRTTMAGSVSQLQDGTLITVGAAQQVGFLLAQRPDGKLVTSFGTNGLATLPATRICSTPFEFCGYPYRPQFIRLARQGIARSAQVVDSSLQVRFGCVRAIAEACQVHAVVRDPDTKRVVGRIGELTIDPHKRVIATASIANRDLANVSDAAWLEVRATFAAAHQQPVHVVRRVKVTD